MLKSFVFAIALVIVPLAAQTTPHRTAPPAQNKSSQNSSIPQGSQGQSSAEKRGTESLPLVVHPDSRPRTKDETDWFEGKERTEASQKKAELILTGVVAVTGLLQIFVLALQWWLIRRQTSHTVNSERAWIWCKADITWNEQNDGKYFGGVGFTFQNSGKTPGFINEIGFAMDVLPNGASLPEIPKDYTGSDFEKWGGRGLLIVPGNTISRLGGLEAEKWVFAQIMGGNMIVWVHGFVRYRDSLVDDQRESRYCFRWNPQRGSGESSFSIQGPEAYNRAN